MDSYNGKHYFIEGKQYTEKQAMKYLTSIGFTTEEATEYLVIIK